MRLLYKSGPMESLRKWFYKPKRDDRSLLAQFFFADDALNMVAAELDSFDGRKDPERCSTLVNQLRHAQDRVLNITSQIMDELLGDERVEREFRVKFPEDVLQDNLAGQLWFGAECLAAGSSIMNREEESAAMRPLAKALTRSLETVRSLLREQCLRPRALAFQQHDDMLHESLRIFDRLFAEFELCYVSAMVNVKTPQEFESQELICVLFSESLRRALKQGLLVQEQVDSYDPALMFAVPRLAIVSGLLIYSSGPLSIDRIPEEMSDMFRPFRTLLHKIRSLLWTLDRRELRALETLLCTNQDIADLADLDLPRLESTDTSNFQYPDIGEFVSRFYADHAQCRDLYAAQQSSCDQAITDYDYLPDNIEVLTPILDGLRRLSNDTEDSIQTPDTLESKESREIIEGAHSTSTSHSSVSTVTFQNSDSKESDRTRKTSKTDSTDMLSLRNLSTNGLMMFDPLVINAVSNSSTSTESNRLLPDQNLVSSLNEQVTEIADRLSSIAVSDSEMILEHSQIHSFSTNDVPALISTKCTSEAYGLDGSRNEPLSCMPSTSHGYLIPNAISQEPVVLASLSHNNSAVFSSEDENSNSVNGAINSDLTLMIPDDIESEIVNTNVTIANANLSTLLLTNEEFRQNFLEANVETPDSDNSFVSAKTTVDGENEGVKFTLGYESDSNELSPSPGDSGVSTENTSLDRSPDADHRKDQHYMKQNRVLQSPSGDKIKDDDARNTLENSFSDTINDVHNNGDVSVNISYVDDSDNQKNGACSSSQCVSVRNDVDSVDSDKCDSNCKVNDCDDERDNVNNELEVRSRRRWDVRQMTELKRQGGGDRKLKALVEESEAVISSRRRNSTEANTSTSQNTANLRRSKVRKSQTKNKKKKGRWSPWMVIIDNRAMMNQNSPLRLDLDHFVDDSSTSCCLSDCADDEEIALALQAQELAARQQARAKFKSSEDLIHRLFVCIAGVADQLQTNFAADLRNILKSVFAMNQTPERPETPPPETPPPEPDPSAQHEKSDTIEYEATEDQVIQNGSSFDSVYSAEEVYADSNSDSAQSETGARIVRCNTASTDTLPRNGPTTSGDRRKSADNVNIQSSVSTGDLTGVGGVGGAGGVPGRGVERAPEWVPDIAAPACMRCSAHFTAFRRRHHCRNCGKVFCATCSANSIPLPRYGQLKPVRVCEECFQVTARTCRELVAR